MRWHGKDSRVTHIYVAEGIEKEMRVGLDLPQVAVIYTPPPIPGGQPGSGGVHQIPLEIGWNRGDWL